MARVTARVPRQLWPSRGGPHLTGESWWLGAGGRAAGFFWHDNAIGMAAMIAFFAFLSTIPLVILLLAAMGDVLGDLISARDVQHLFQSIMPGLTQQQFLATYWHPVHHSKVATKAIGVVGLLLGTSGLHDSVDWAVNRIWQAPRSRSFWIAKLRGLGVILWVIAFALFSLWLTWLWSGVLGLANIRADSDTAVLALLPSLVLDTAIFGALYKLTPTVHVRLRPALIAGVLAAVLWQVSKIAFGWWVAQIGTYNRVYGPLAASVIVMLWLWISAMIFLYGAELTAVLQRQR
jgi:membrane protein